MIPLNAHHQGGAMSHRSIRLRVPASALAIVFLASGIMPRTYAATTSDQPTSGQEQQTAKPMMKKEPMMGEMKKDGMMKEGVSKSAQKWDAKMNESMKQEKMQ
jgi:hypothetical protein